MTHEKQNKERSREKQNKERSKGPKERKYYEPFDPKNPAYKPLLEAIDKKHKELGIKYETVDGKRRLVSGQDKLLRKAMKEIITPKTPKPRQRELTFEDEELVRDAVNIIERDRERDDRDRRHLIDAIHEREEKLGVKMEVVDGERRPIPGQDKLVQKAIKDVVTGKSK